MAPVVDTLRRYFARQIAAGRWPLVAVARGARGVLLDWQTDFGPRFRRRWAGCYMARERHPDDPLPRHASAHPVREIRRENP